MQRFLKLIQTNYVLSILITLFILFFYPPISKYNWKEDAFRSLHSAINIYIDVNNNRHKELLSISSDKNGYGILRLQNKKKILLNSSNIPFKPILNEDNNIVFDNIDNNSFTDIVFLGKKNDSLFLLNAEYNYGVSIRPSIHSYFLDLVKSFNGHYQPYVKLKIQDMDKDGSKEVVVLVSSGLTILPRRLYTVNIQNGSIYKSPISGSYIDNFLLTDLNNDGKKEILVQSKASCNIREEVFLPEHLDSNLHDFNLLENKNILLQNSDCAVWLTVLDEKLNYVFKPKAFRGKNGNLQSIPLPLEGKNKQIISIYSNDKDTTRKPHLLIHNTKGELISDFEINTAVPMYPPLSLKTSLNSDNTNVLLVDKKGQVFSLDNEYHFHYIDKISEPLSDAKTIISNLEGGPLRLDFSKDYLRIYNQDSKLLKEFYHFGISKSYKYASISKTKKNTETLLINTDAFEISLSMSLNPIYKFRFLIWLLIYLFVWILLGIIKRFFSYKVIQEKNRIEQIAEDRTKEIEKQKDDLKKLAIDLKEKNEIVFQQNKELNKRREEIETLYDKLTSSITYGKGIKDALLPSENDLKNIFPNSFHFFNPQNILGGDFYWIAKNNNRKILIVGDASGQGVSGAFLSLFAISMFNNINFDTSTKAASILKSLNNGIHKHFSNYLKNIDDGFELAVVIFDENDNNQRIKIEFSSANIPLYYFESDQVLNMKKLEANDFCVRADINALSFATQTVEVPKGTMLYLATKGLSQQIGGDREETFGKSKLKANLMKIHVLEIEKQKEIITQTFEKWKGINEQTDDVLFVGVRI